MDEKALNSSAKRLGARVPLLLSSEVAEESFCQALDTSLDRHLIMRQVHKSKVARKISLEMQV